MRVLTTDEFGAHLGQVLGSSDWVEVDQDRVDLFAKATDDHQWIHVDLQRAAEGPFGTTIAHGYLTLSLLPSLVQQVFRVSDVASRVNYGLNKVRFPSPVLTGSRLRAVATVVGVTPTPGGVQLALRVVVEVEGMARPACVAETVTLLVR